MDLKENRNNLHEPPGEMHGRPTPDEGIPARLLSLLQRFRDGDVDAYEEIYYRLSAPMLRLLRHLLPTCEDAEDATQDVFMKLWNSREKIDVSKDIRPLLYVMARQASVNYYRRARVREEYITGNVFDTETVHDSLDEVIAKETELLTRLIVEKMSSPRREIYSMWFDQALTNSEIAQKLGLTPEVVKKQLFLARKQIRDGVAIMLVFLLPGNIN